MPYRICTTKSIHCMQSFLLSSWAYVVIIADVPKTPTGHTPWRHVFPFLSQINKGASGTFVETLLSIYISLHILPLCTVFNEGGDICFNTAHHYTAADAALNKDAWLVNNFTFYPILKPKSGAMRVLAFLFNLYNRVCLPFQVFQWVLMDLTCCPPFLLSSSVTC